MQSIASRLGINCLFVAVISFLIVLAMNPEVISSSLPSLSDSQLLSFKTMLISIILEALPFMLLGVIVSSVLHIFVPESWIRKLTPRNLVGGILAGCLLGILFPICECGMVPVVRRLIRKGMPPFVAVVFIFAGPIINPIVFVATYTAFRSRPEMVYARMGLAFCVAAVIGLVVYAFIRQNPLRLNEASERNHHHEHASNDHQVHHHYDHSHDHHAHNHDHHLHHSHDHSHAHGHTHENGKLEDKIFDFFNHVCSEFFDMGKYLMFGSIVTAAIQTFLDRGSLIHVGSGTWTSHLFMMGFAFILSLCSTSDAFVAASFTGTFTAGSLLTFLVFGPMLDLKSTLMLLSVFRTRFVLFLIVLISVSVFIGSIITERLFLI